MARLMESVTTIKFQKIADLKGIADQIQEGDKSVHLVGTVLGKVNGIGFHDNPNGDEPSKSLRGGFEVTLADPARAPIIGTGIFLHESFTERIASIVLRDVDQKLIPKVKPSKLAGAIIVPGMIEIPITVEVGIRKAANKNGYEWSVTSIADDDPEAMDPFASQRQLLAGRPAGAMMQLTDQRSTTIAPQTGKLATKPRSKKK